MSKIVIITLALAILFFCSTYILDFFYGLYLHTFELGWLRGEKTKEEVVTKYIEGLKARNGQIIERLVPKTHEATREIREKIERFKESDFSKIEIYYGEEPSPLNVKIKNIRLKSEEITSDEIFIERDCHQYTGIIECKKWYLLIGTVKEKFRSIPSVMELERN